MSEALEKFKADYFESHSGLTIEETFAAECAIDATWSAALDQPSTAEAKARALEDFAKKMRAESAQHPTISAHAYGLNLAADKAEAEAKRIREEAK